MKKMMLIIAFGLVGAFFCCDKSPTSSKYDPPTDHTISKDGAKHKSGLQTPLENCTSCHGSDLKGGSTGVSCYDCHGKKW